MKYVIKLLAAAVLGIVIYVVIVFAVDVWQARTQVPPTPRAIEMPAPRWTPDVEDWGKG